MIIHTVVILLILPALPRAELNAHPQVQTNSGPVEGVVVTNSNNQSVNAYYGIPYAQPPVGELRFQTPKPVTNWTSILKANKPSPPCYQKFPKKWANLKDARLSLERPWSEDCLTLNIWTPSPKPEKAPVIAFIHGGAFLIGSSVWFIDGTALALDGVVVVTMNYRLGVFGFLNLGVSDAPGNVGLMDQNLALRWIKANVETFGGDPESITLAGMSAGSASVGYQLLSPKSNGLFKRTIMMSGVPTNPWAIQEPEKSIEKSKKLLDSVGCPSQNSSLALKCLTQKHPEDILELCSSFDNWSGEIFLPTVDGEFIVEHPSVSISTGRFNPGEVMVGSSTDEGGQIMVMVNSKSFKTSDGRLPRREFSNVIRNVREGLSELQVETLNVVYTKWKNPDDPLMLRDAAEDMYSDRFFVCGINEFIESLSRTGNPVYRYVFDHKMAIANYFFPAWLGASHAQDQIHVLANIETLKKFGASATDLEVSRRFLKQYTSFARHGDPNFLSEDEFPGEPRWPPFKDGHKYKIIRAQSSIENYHGSRECAVWLSLIPDLENNKNC